MTMKLTRFLYNKMYVEYSLLLSLLKRDQDEALFWSFELYFSGFKRETLLLLWKYYFTLYSAFYVSLEPFLQEQTNIWLDNQSDHKVIGTIVLNLVSREPCIDTYCMMHNMLPHIEIIRAYCEDIQSSNEPLKCLNVLKSYVKNNDCFKGRGQKGILKVLKKTLQIDLLRSIAKYACISRLLSGLFLLDTDNKMDPKKFIYMDEERLEQYMNDLPVIMKAWKIPKKRCVYTVSIPPHNEAVDTNSFFHNWIFYTWETPVWRNRIQSYNGDKCDTSIMFQDEDEEEEFFNYFNFEPDEQRIEVINNWLGEKTFESWEDIYNTYSLDVLHEWLHYKSYII